MAAETEHTAGLSGAGGRSPRRLAIEPGTMEALKWFAVLLMTLDHVNRYLLNLSYPWMSGVGRLAMPLFVFVLAYHLALPSAAAGRLSRRLLERLLPVAAISSLPWFELNAAGSGPLPINILFTLAAGTAMVALIEQPTRRRELAAIAIFALAGWVVDYRWNGIALFIACWHYFRKPGWFWGGACIALLALLVQANDNFWALAALPVIALAFVWRLPVRRIRGALYVYYPLHLCLLVVLRIALFDR